MTSEQQYNEEAITYDLLNEARSNPVNELVANILATNNCKTVLDGTCGTGSQVFYLSNHGFSCVGVDINNSMLEIAINKLKKMSSPQNVPAFINGDICSIGLDSSFDAAITISNAVGHLTASDFLLAMQNINKQLADSGIYIFDIFNLEYFLSNKDNITELTIDWPEQDKNGNVIRKIQYSTVDDSGILASYTTSINAQGVTQNKQTLQIYRLSDLENMLEKSGFTIKQVFNLDNDWHDCGGYLAARMLIVAAKRF